MNEIKLYGGKITLHYEEHRHRYVKDGKSVPSVSGCLAIIEKPALVGWAARITAEYLAEKLPVNKPIDELEKRMLIEGAKAARFDRSRKKMSIGSLVHEWVDDYIKGKEPPKPKNKEVRRGVEQFLKFVKVSGAKFVESERPIYSTKHGYAGRFDFIVKIGKGKYMGDLKTGSDIYLEHHLQTSAYMHAYKEEFPREQFDGTLILNVREDGTVHTKIVSYLSALNHQEAFLCALRLYNSITLLRKEEENE